MTYTCFSYKTKKFRYTFGKSIETAEEKWYKCTLGKIWDWNMWFGNLTKLDMRLFWAVQFCL